MTDRELLELAAKAVGEDVEWHATGSYFYRKSCDWPAEKGFFNPLHDDGEALRLAMNLRLDILQDERSITVQKWCSVNAEVMEMACVQIDGCRFKSTRRAIVEAAAAIGKAMP